MLIEPMQLPYDYNMVTNTSVKDSDAIHILAKSSMMSKYTLCALRSFRATSCSTRLDASGTTGVKMEAHCEDPLDDNAYSRSAVDAVDSVSTDWVKVAEGWGKSVDLNGGTYNNNASKCEDSDEFDIAAAVTLTPTSLHGGGGRCFRQLDPGRRGVANDVQALLGTH